MAEDPMISYSLKDVLGDINRKLDLALGLINSKANASDVHAIDTRLRKVEGHIERVQENTSTREHHREWLIPVVITAVLALFTILQVFHI